MDKTAPKKDPKKLQPLGSIEDDLSNHPEFHSIFRQNVSQESVFEKGRIAPLSPSHFRPEQRRWSGGHHNSSEASQNSSDELIQAGTAEPDVEQVILVSGPEPEEAQVIEIEEHFVIEIEDQYRTVMSQQIPIRHFHGRSNESVEDFIAAVKVNFTPKSAVYATATEKDEAKLMCLKMHMRGGAAEWMARQDPGTVATWEKVTEAMRARYAQDSKREDRANEAHRAMLNMSQGKGQSLQKYIKRAYRIKDDLGPNFDTILASNFIHGMSDVNLRLYAMAFGKLDGLSSFADTVKAVKAMAQGCGVKVDKYDESSEEEYDTDSEDESDYQYRRKQRRTKRKKGRRVRKQREESEGESEGEAKSKGKKGVIDEEGVARIVERLLRTGMGKSSEPAREELVREFGEPAGRFPQTVEAFAAFRQPRGSQAPPQAPFPGQTYQQPGQPTSGGIGYAQYNQMPQYGPAVQYGQPLQTARENQPPAFGGRRACTCFRCGEAGHYSYECVSLTPLSREEQWRVKQQVEGARMQRGGAPQYGQPEPAYGQSEPVYGQVSSQPYRQPQGQHDGHQPVGPGMGASGDGRLPGTGGAQVRTVAMVEAVSKGEEMQVPRVSLVEWFEASAVEKNLKRSMIAEATDSGEPKRTRARQGPSQGEPVNGEARIAEKPDAQSRAEEKGKQYNPPGPSRARKPKVEKGNPARQPIRMMKEMIPPDIVAQLRDTPVSGLCWGTLFDLAPAVRRDVAKGLVLERPPRGRKGVKQGQVAEVLMAERRGVALPDDGKAVNFYTTARVIGPAGIYDLQRVLVDGGSVVNLMPEDVARRMNLLFERSTDLMIKTADSQLTAIHYYVDLKLEVAGVTARLRAYVVPGGGRSSYALLLSRRWLRQCRARGNYETDTYVIKDAQGTEYQVQSLPSGKLQEAVVPTVVVNPHAATVELDDETLEELSMGEDLIAAIVNRIVQESHEEEYDAESESVSEDEGEEGLPGKGPRY